MIINLSPVFSDEKIEASVNGDKITVNGELFDFSPLGNSQRLPSRAIDSPWFVGDVSRSAKGEIELTLRFPHPENASKNMRFPEPVRSVRSVVKFPENQNKEPEVIALPVIEESEAND